jgi:hypothetical protein
MIKILIISAAFVAGLLWGSEVLQFLAGAAEELAQIASGG